MKKPKSILLLGANSFVGRRFVSRLSGGTSEVHLVARSESVFKQQKGVYYHKTSLDDEYMLKAVLPSCDIVFHLASETTPGYSAFRPTLEATNNLLPTLRFLECLQLYKDVRLVFVSSGGAVYGNISDPFASEMQTLSPLSYYGAGKAALEKFIIAFSNQTGCSSIIVRPSNFFGPEQPFRSGFGVVSTIFNHLQKSKAIDIWGDGEIVRDYLYIDDFIDLCLMFMENHFEEGKCSVYNVGSGTGVTLNKLCSLIEGITGREIKRRYQQQRVVDVERIVLDNSKILRDCGWSAQTSLKDGLTKTWEWFCSQQKNI